MYTVLGLLKFLPFSAAQWAAPRLHESYLSHHESSVELLLAEHFNQQQQEVPETGQQSSYLTAGVLSLTMAEKLAFTNVLKRGGTLTMALGVLATRQLNRKEESERIR